MDGGDYNPDKISVGVEIAVCSVLALTSLGLIVGSAYSYFKQNDICPQIERSNYTNSCLEKVVE